jgi:hypothetical protein
MLNLNRPLEAKTGGEADAGWSSEWKVLVFDGVCRDIISPLMTVAELRKQGVTLNLLLDAARDAITDVPAVYFVAPTADNIKRIVADCSDGLYARVYVNFSSPLPRPLLEQFARAALQANCVGQIVRMHDQFLNFVSLEPTLFTLNHRRSYVMYNDPRLPDTQVCVYVVASLMSRCRRLSLIVVR